MNVSSRYYFCTKVLCKQKSINRQQFIINLTQVKIINICISPKIELIFNFSINRSSIYFLN